MAIEPPIMLRIAGRKDAVTGVETLPSHAGTPPEGFGVKVTVKGAVQVQLARGPGDVAEVPAQSDDVIGLTMDGGARLFLRADEAATRLQGAGRRSLTRPGAIELGPSLPLEDGATRGGASDWAIRQLRNLGVDLQGKTARFIGQRADEHLVPKPGVYHWPADAALTDGSPVEQVEGAGPFLVFLHGTLSSTISSFGGLSASSEYWEPLQRRYPNRVLALQHHTLLRSPIGNAVELVRRLPVGAKLHLVSHSRGGLIGDLLTRAQRQSGDAQPALPFDDLDRTALAGPEYAQQRAELDELNRFLIEKRPVIERFVRVACPARGTTLASERLDRWLNLMLNLLGFAAESAGSPAVHAAYDAAQAFLLAVVKERTDPRTIPGLEAMMPGSPLIKLLNRPDLRSNADLSVVEGDAVPSGVLRRLGIWFADLFYSGDNDLVVNTASMRGGVGRAASRWFFDQGSTVDHFHYFRNSQTAKQVLAGLSRADAELGGFNPAVEGTPDPVIPSRGRRGAADDRAILYVLPDLFGSHLSAGGQRIWIDLLQLAGGGLTRLAIDQPGIVADALAGSYYAGLCDRLADRHEVRPWPYDWRQDLGTLGAAFATTLAAALDEGARPVRIVAHGLGGLVARAALLDPRLWAAFRDRETCRLVELGTPCGGSFAAPMLLLGRARLGQALAAVDMTSDARTLAAIWASLPGILALLPDHPGIDFHDPDTWSRLLSADAAGPDWPAPSAEALEAARAMRVKLAGAPADPRRMFYIAGQGPTVDGITLELAAPASERMVFSRSNEGDGQVLWRTGIPPGLQPCYSPANHGDLVRHEPTIAAIDDLLQQGTTDRLLANARNLVVGRTQLDPVFRDALKIQPAADDLAHAALGGAPAPPPVLEPKTRIRVVHGHLAFARYPMMIGHYTGDTIAGAEAQLQLAIKPLLSDRMQLGLYAGPIGTTTIVLDPASRPRGAVVVGLGDAGSLALGSLQRALRHGLLAYAAAEGDRQRAQLPGFWGLEQVTEMDPIGISTVLIGSGYSGLDRSSCVLALLRGAARARLGLAALKGMKLRLKEIEIIELFEGEALDIWHTVREQLEASLELAGLFELAEPLQRSPGARRRLGGGWDRSWWQPIQITMPNEPGGERNLVFTVTGGLARAESRVIAADLDIVETLMRRAIDPDGGPVDAAPGRTLFELLMPLSLKEEAREDRNRRLLLDKESARFPWELLDDRRPWSRGGELPDGNGRKPQAVRAGLLRQLLETKFREQVVTPHGTRRALVIGDPRGAPAQGFAELIHAQAEAEAVARLLEQTHEVRSLIGAEATPERVVEALFGQAWDIIHIAAHGVVDEMLPGSDGVARKVTGVILGAGVVLGPPTLSKLAVSPSLVFVNCCYLGAISRDAEQAASRAGLGGSRPDLAASVAVELIRAGASAVVAAGWAVEDQAAQAFATTFYAAMTGGTTFGAATRSAREAAYDLRPRGNTWGAYQCYGEPDFRLPGHPPFKGEAGKEKPLAAAIEAVALAESIREDLNVGLQRMAGDPGGRLCGIEQQAKSRGWLNGGELLVALAEAWAELGDLPKAIRLYEAARRGADSRFRIRAIEQLANLQSRHALTTFRAMPEAARDWAAAFQTIEAARMLIVSLTDALGGTQERWSIQGGVWKRLAQLRQGTESIPALEQMADAYGEAERIGRADRFYPALMRCAAEIALDRLDGRGTPKSTRSTIEDIAQNPLTDEADFWQHSRVLDARLLLAVEANAIDPAEEADILRGYVRAWEHLGSAVKLRSVVEHLEFLTDMLTLADRGLTAALGRIRDALDARIRDSRNNAGHSSSVG